SDSIDAQRAVETLGNVSLLERPVRTIGLISAVHSALRARERQYQVRLADQRKDEFLATLAHELRNPLAPIRTSMSIISRLQPLPEIARLSAIVDRQVMHLTRLVDDLLDVARITTGKVVLQSQRTTLRSVLTHALEIASSAIQDRRHRLTVIQPEEEHPMDADHARVVQSLANLLGNAAKFTPPGGEIVVTATVDGPLAQFRVRDNGKGLAPKSLETIFELFAQAPTPGEPASGLGIGLNLARQFAQMHGGTIEASSEGLGRGSTFVLSLPVVVPADAMGGAPAPAPSDRTERRRVLVVDDNIDAADTLQAFLDIEGFSTAVAYDGQAAVEAVSADPPDVVLMDIGMPRMDGYEAARRIRAATRGIRLIALTGWGQELDRQKAELAGFDRHFVKPVDLQKLLDCLETP
ncbi:MAG: response regulator, partial [Comamonadaceae bacterium]